MIYLQEIVEKLSYILNSQDNPIADNYYFEVQSVGFHADSVMSKSLGKNFIRVFVSTMGGNFNPVFGLGEASYNIPITFYFPVRFKGDMFALDAYLHQTLVGANINYGENSGYAVSNLSIAQFGEIQDLDFKEFKSWADSQYGKPIEVFEAYLSMGFNLYLSTIKDTYVYGNDITATLGWGEHLLNLVFSTGSLQSATQGNDEQTLGTNESDSLPYCISYGASFQVYLGTDDASKDLVQKWLSNAIYNQTFLLTINFPSYDATFQRQVYIASANLPIQKGQPLVLSLTFAKKYTGA